MDLMRCTIFLLVTSLFAGCQSPRPAEPEPVPVSPAATATLEPLRPGVWVHASYRDTDGFGRVLSNGLVVASGSEALLVNTPWDQNPDSSTTLLLQEAESVTGAPIRRAVGTHFHDDSVGGFTALREAGIPAYVTALTAGLMEGQGLDRPDSVFTGEGEQVWTLRYGDREVEVFYAGGGHTADNIVVYIPDARVLFGGCLIRPGESGSLGNTADAVLEEWAETVARVRERYRDRVDVVVPTHGAPAGPELLDHTIRLVEVYRNRMESQ